MSSKTPLIIGALAVISAFLYFGANKAKKFIGYLTYELSSFRVHSASLSSIKCKVAIAVNNPSATAVSIKDYKIEVFLVNSDKSRSLLASSPVNQLAIPEMQKVTITTDISISPLQAAKLVKNLVQTLLKGNVSEVIAALQSEIKSNTVVVLKADVLGTFIEKELKW